MSGNYCIKAIFGKNLKRLRESKRLTQEQLAEALGLQTYQTINRVENGKTFVTIELYEKICCFFKIEPYILLLKEEQEYNPDTIDKIEEINMKLNDILTFLKKNSSKEK